MGRCTAMALLGLFTCATSAIADPVKIACEGETVTIPGWGAGTMMITYDGASPGTLAVKGAHLDFSVPAAAHKYDSPLPPLTIDGSGATTAILPDLKAVDSCAAGKMKSNSEADTYSVFAMSCMEDAPASAAPVPVKAAINLTFMRSKEGLDKEPLVSMKLTYLEKSSSPAGTLDIDLLPKDCKLVP